MNHKTNKISEPGNRTIVINDVLNHIQLIERSAYKTSFFFCSLFHFIVCLDRAQDTKDVEMQMNN